MKRTIAALAIIGLSLTACGKDETASNTPPKQQTSDASPTNKTMAPPATTPPANQGQSAPKTPAPAQ
jgi:hypothetical protein